MGEEVRISSSVEDILLDWFVSTYKNAQAGCTQSCGHSFLFFPFLIWAQSGKSENEPLYVLSCLFLKQKLKVFFYFTLKNEGCNDPFNPTTVLSITPCFKYFLNVRPELSHNEKQGLTKCITSLWIKMLNITGWHENQMFWFRLAI